MRARWFRRVAVLALALALPSCAPSPRPLDLLLVNGRVYTLTWPEPALDGTPDVRAPHSRGGGWHPDASAVGLRGGRVVFVGQVADAEHWRPAAHAVIDLAGASVVPGLIDSHTHVAELGASLERVNLVGVQTEAEAIARVVERARTVPAGEWIVGWGWDEGAWANRYPDMTALSTGVPDHPVVLRGLHGYAVWGNRLAFERAGITASTPAPTGGDIRKDRDGRPTGILVNTAGTLLARAIPPPTADQLDTRIRHGLEAMAAAGYTEVHEAGAGADEMSSFERLDAAGRLPVRVYAMLDARDSDFIRTWLARGPDRGHDRMLTTRAVKAFYDGALGSRGARLLDDYSDRPGERGVSGTNYGFDETLVAATMRRGFQVCVHAIGDAANRATLDFFESVFAEWPEAKAGRHRIEHAQVLAPDDIGRFPALDIIASMEPPHAVEDRSWAEARLGPIRIKGAYAWRSLRRDGARLVFNSDLPGTDYDIFYGLHSAITRQGRDGQPVGGWYPVQRMTAEEALRGYTIWGAYAGFEEEVGGTIAPGRRADLTIMDLDPLVVGSSSPQDLLHGRIVMTIVNGRVAFRASGQR
jgi:predicted amidohydrolase YtcJ